MALTKFYYNPKTLRFERTRFSVVRIGMSIVSYLVFGFVFFVALLLLQNLIIETPTEKKLRAENHALDEHKVILTTQLLESGQQLSDLKQQDLLLYQKLFETSAPSSENQMITPEREEILVSDASEFNESVTQLGNRFSELVTAARNGNNFFGLNARVGRSDIAALAATPAIAPIENFQLENLVSGYGIRINPFHKGNYHHDGVDIAAPRGTTVLVTAPGKVLITKKSDLIAGYGNYIEIDHGNGIITRYSHLEEIEVRTGQKVNKGQTIGTVGSTGGSIAPHLHYEVVVNGSNVDPIKFFMEGISSAQYEVLVELSRKQNQSLD